MTPIEVVAGYTVFANGGTRAEPVLIDRVVDYQGGVIEHNPIQTHQALDPRVAYQVTTLLQDVIDHGTGASVRARGFMGPAAGKTGTSRDGWFAGYTSELLCIVWVGFDDNTDLDLEGAHSAAPIWAQFMQSALKFREYRDTKPFLAPDGIVSIDIDPLSGMPATAACPTRRSEVYISGSQPLESCPLHGGGRIVTHVTGWETTPSATVSPTPAETLPRITGSGSHGLP